MRSKRKLSRRADSATGRPHRRRHGKQLALLIARDLGGDVPPHWVPANAENVAKLSGVPRYVDSKEKPPQTD